MDMQMQASQATLRRRHSDFARETNASVITQFYLLHVLPVALMPAASLLYAWEMHTSTFLRTITFGQAAALGLLLVLMELAVVPTAMTVLQALAPARTHAHGRGNDLVLSAIAPLMLLVTPLFLFVPALANWGVIGATVAASLLLVLGTQAALLPPGREHGRALGWSVINATTLGWLAIVAISFAAWGGMPA